MDMHTPSEAEAHRYAETLSPHGEAASELSEAYDTSAVSDYGSALSDACGEAPGSGAAAADQRSTALSSSPEHRTRQRDRSASLVNFEKEKNQRIHEIGDVQDRINILDDQIKGSQHDIEETINVMVEMIHKFYESSSLERSENKRKKRAKRMRPKKPPIISTSFEHEDSAGDGGGDGVELDAHEAALALDMRDYSSSLSDQHRHLLESTLKDTFLFALTSEAELQLVIQSMRYCEVNRGDVIVEQGHQGGAFYVVFSGLVKAEQNGEQTGVLVPGDGFGELSLLYAAPHEATMVAIEPTVVWALDRRRYQNLVVHQASDHRKRLLEFVKSVPLLQPLGEEKLSTLSRALHHATYAAEEVIIHEGEVGDSFYMIYSGSVRCMKREEQVVQADDDFNHHHQKGQPWDHNTFLCNLKTSDFFGELALMDNAKRAATVVANEQTECYVLGKDEFDVIIGPLKDQLDDRARMRLLQQMLPTMYDCDDTQLEKMVEVAEKKTFRRGHMLICEGNTATHFYVIKSGMVKVTQWSNTLKMRIALGPLGNGKYCGERGLLDTEDSNHQATASVEVTSETAECLVFDKEQFTTWLAPYFLQYINEGNLLSRAGSKSVTSVEGGEDAFSADMEKKHLQAKALRRNVRLSVNIRNTRSFKMELSDLQEVRTLCNGTFGKITVVQGQKSDEELDGMDHSSHSGGDSFNNTREAVEAYGVGEWTPDEIRQRPVDCFEIFDKQGSGRLSVNELCFIARSTLTQELKAQNALERDGEEGEEEGSTGGVRTAPDTDIDMDIFRLFDIDGDGEIDQSEFIDVVSELEDEAVLRFIGLHCHQHQISLANTRFYVLKGMQKAKMLQMNRKHAALREKHVRERLYMPYIQKFHSTLNDRNQVYLLLEYVPSPCTIWDVLYRNFRKRRVAAEHLAEGYGATDTSDTESETSESELDENGTGQDDDGYTTIKKLKKSPLGGLPMELVREWSSMIVAAVEHMHAQRVIHRDLRPENIRIAWDGNLKICDFSCSKIVPYKNHAGEEFEETYTLCGTPEYMPPEIVLSLGHATPVDFWGLGVLIYEMLCAATPFDVEAEGNERETFERVIRCQRYLTFPMGFGANARSIIRKLVHPTPQLRLGALKSGFRDIKNHLFFVADGATDWKSVEAGVVEPKIFLPGEFGFHEEIPDPASFDDDIMAYQFLSLNENEQWFGEFS